MREKQNKRTFLASSLVLLLFLNLFLVVAVQPLKASQRDNVFWVVDIGDNIADFAVADGKVFTRTFHGVLYCFDQNYGSTIWNYTIIYDYVMWGPLITVADGKVFTGSQGSVLSCLNENTGELLWEFQPNLTSSIASKSPPYFTVMGGKAFTTGDGFYVLNATDGKLMWESTGPDRFGGPGVIANGRVLMVSSGGPPTYDKYLNSLNADNGEVLWTYKIFTFLESSPVVADGRVLVWDRSENQTMLCLDEASGSFLWKYDVGAKAFQPTIANGLVLFGASDGNFYALNESDGTLKWKYQTSYQVATGYSNFATPKVALDRVFTGYEVGYIRSLNLSNGQSIWVTPVSNEVHSLTLGNDTLYVTAGTDLYDIDVDNGNVQWMKHFDYWVLPPIFAYNKLFVAADLKVIAYGEPDPTIFTADIEFVSADYPDTILISGTRKSFKVSVLLENEGRGEAKNVRLGFQPNYGNVSFLSSEEINVPSGQTRSVSIRLNAVNTGITHEANFRLNIVYETPQGKTKSLSTPDIFLIVVPTSPPPFYTTPLGIAFLVIVAVIVGVVISTIIFRKRKKME